MDAEKWLNDGAALKAEFAKSDLQNHGFIPQDVFKAVFRNLGAWSDGEFELLFAKVAQNGGKVKYEELPRESLLKLAIVCKRWDALLKFVEDGKEPPLKNSVIVDLDVFKAVFRNLGNWSDEEFEVLFAKVAQKDGKVKYEELPRESLLKLAIVCKRWDALMKFVEDCKEPPQKNSVIVDLLCMRESAMRREMERRGIGAPPLSQESVSESSRKAHLLRL